MSRSVDLWVGKDDDAAIPPRVKLRVWERCGGRCAITGRKLRPGDAYEFDHIIPLILGGAHAEANLQLVSREAHKEKTREDVAIKSKVARVRAKFLGVFPKTKRPLKSRGFEPSRKEIGK